MLNAAQAAEELAWLMDEAFRLARRAESLKAVVADDTAKNLLDMAHKGACEAAVGFDGCRRAMEDGEALAKKYGEDYKNLLH